MRAAILTALACALAGCGSEQRPTCATFDGRQNTGANPRGVTIADFNGDGIPDVATANSTSRDVSVLLGNGDGSFQPRATLTAGYGPLALAHADLDGDGRVDLVVTNGNAHELSVLRGNGDGSFQDQVQYPTGGNAPTSVAIADFNGDGRPDLAVANPGFATSRNDWYGIVSVLLGQGDGTFAAAVSYVSGLNPYSMAIAIADFDGDGKLDIAAANGGVDILRGQGDGTFAAAVTVVPRAPGYASASVATGDLDGDGRPDLALIGNGQSGVLLGNGDGTFRAQLDAGNDATSVAVADFNGDGRLDLATAGNTAVTLALGNGDGSFQSPASYPADSGTLALAAGDLDRDGKPDLAVTYFRDRIVRTLRGHGDGTLEAPPPVFTSTTGVRPAALVSGDFDRDGKPDLVVANSYSNDLNVLLGNGAGSFGSRGTWAIEYMPRALVSDDFNHDGKLDVAAADYGYNTISVLIGNGDGTLQPAVSYLAGQSPTSLASGDFDRDGNLDLVAVSEVQTPSNGLSLLLGNGDGSFVPAGVFAAGGHSASVTAGDFDGDGRLDVAWANLNAGLVTVLRGHGDATFDGAVEYKTGAGGIPVAIVSGDFNRDHRLDLAVAGRAGVVSVLLNGGDGVFAAPALYDTASHPTSLTAADLDGDHVLDLVMTDRDSNSAMVLRGAKDGTFAPAIAYAAGPYPSSVVVADFNGDGRPDLAVADADTNQLRFLPNLDCR